MTLPHKDAVKKVVRERPKEYPSVVHVADIMRANLAKNDWIYDFSVWNSFEENGFSVYDKINLADYLEDLYLIILTDEDLATATTPARLVERIQKRILEPPAKKR